MRTVAIIALFSAGLLFLTGCVPNEGPVAFAPQNGDSGDALLTGTIHITTECLTVSDGTDVVIPIFPAFEARFDDGVLTFGGEYRDGDEITLLGGETAVGAPIPDDWYIPAGCPDIPLWKTGPYLRPS
jgi:hypothetical protein